VFSRGYQNSPCSLSPAFSYQHTFSWSPRQASLAQLKVAVFFFVSLTLFILSAALSRLQRSGLTCSRILERLDLPPARFQFSPLSGGLGSTLVSVFRLQTIYGHPSRPRFSLGFAGPITTKLTSFFNLCFLFLSIPQ